MIEQAIVHLPELVKDFDRPVFIYLVHLSSRSKSSRFSVTPLCPLGHPCGTGITVTVIGPLSLPSRRSRKNSVISTVIVWGSWGGGQRSNASCAPLGTSQCSSSPKHP